LQYYGNPNSRLVCDRGVRLFLALFVFGSDPVFKLLHVTEFLEQKATNPNCEILWAMQHDSVFRSNALPTFATRVFRTRHGRLQIFIRQWCACCNSKSSKSKQQKEWSCRYHHNPFPPRPNYVYMDPYNTPKIFQVPHKPPAKKALFQLLPVRYQPAAPLRCFYHGVLSGSA